MSYENHFKKMKSKEKTAASKPKIKSKVRHTAKVRRQKSRRKAGTPWGLVISLVMGTVLSLWGYQSLDEVDRFIGGIEIGFFGQASAQETKAPTSSPDQEKTAAAANKEMAMQCPPVAKVKKEDVSHYDKLAERKQQLDLREQELAKVEEDLQKKKAEIEVQIQRLEKVRADISGVLKERVEMDQERVATLVDFYSNMKPKQAADIFNTLNEDLAIEVLGKMKKKNAAAILNLLEPAKAKTLSEKFTGYKKR